MNNTKQKGFTLFIALIVTSILLTVGFSIGNIILRQLRLATSGRESQVAFYAADSAAECAQYWDRKVPGGGTADFNANFGTSSPAPSFISCGTGFDGTGTTSPTKTVSGNIATTTFYIDYKDTLNGFLNSCAKVVVVKNGSATTIDARGYNAPFVQAGSVGICDISNARTVERGLLYQY